MATAPDLVGRDPTRTAPLARTWVLARRAVRRRRRVVAAVLAGTGCLLALTAIRGTPPTAGLQLDSPDPGIRMGEVAVPVVLASGAIAATLAPGDVVDLVAVDDLGTATVVASRARVLELPGAGGTLSATTSAVVLVAVPEARALPLTAASTGGAVTVVIRPA